MSGWYELREHPDGFEFQLRASNGGLLLTGFRRLSMDEARRTLEEVREWVGDPLHIERRVSARGEPFFVVLGARQEDLAQSPPWMTSISREYAIESARLYGASEDVRVITVSTAEFTG